MTALFRPGRLAVVGIALFCLSSAFAQTMTTTTTTTKVSVEVPGVVDVIGNGKIDWSKSELRAIGIGFAPAFATSPAQITALAREAAIVSAERNLLKVICGVEVNSDTTVENLVLTQDTIKTHVEGLLRGAIIINEKPYGENGYQVVLAVNLYGNNSTLAGSINLANQFKVVNPGATIVPAAVSGNNPPAVLMPSTPSTPSTPSVSPAPDNSTACYTGVVIDCRGMDLTRSMCPRLLDQTGINLWNSLTVSAELVNERGIAGYYASLDDPAITDRVGKNPLVIKALRVSGGKTFKTDAVLSPADAATLLAEDAKTKFLQQLNVAFLVEK